MKSSNEKDLYPNFEKMYEDIAQAGFPDVNEFSNGTEYINAIKPVSTTLINIVLKWMPNLEYPIGILLFLRESKNKYDGRILIPIFNEADSQGKWRICDAIEHNPPLYINDWVKETYLSPEYGADTGLLALAVAKMFSGDEARKILRAGFDLHPGITPEALGKVGKPADIVFLEEKYKGAYPSKSVYKEIEKAIKKIKKRAKIL